MARPRNKENAGLPKRWRHVHGGYYYQVPPGQESNWDGKKTFRLGATLPEAYGTWAERLKVQANVRTIADLLDRYALECIPKKKVTTQAQNKVAIRKIRIAFERFSLNDLKPRHIYQYVDGRDKKTAAHREVEILSHAFTKAVEWGYIDRHPFKQEVRLQNEKPRDRYVEDWEIVECLSLKPRRKAGSVLAVQAYIRVKLLTGLRRGDLLRLTMSELKENGIHVTPGKTADSSGARLIISWSDELRAAIEFAKAYRPVQLSPFLFCNRRGQGYFSEETGRAGGWDSMWRGFMQRVLAETKVEDRFNENDLRAKCASDAPSLEHARSLLAHADSKITQRVYRRKAETVKPIR